MPWRLWPRTIRGQMIAGLLLLEVLSIGLFAAVLARQQVKRANTTIRQRLTFEATSMALQSSQAWSGDKPEWIGLSVAMMGRSPSVAEAKVTDLSGNVLFASNGTAQTSKLDPEEAAQIARLHGNVPRIFDRPGGITEAVTPIDTGRRLRGFAWVENNRIPPREQLYAILTDTLVFGVIWVLASTFFMLLLSRSITQPLALLHAGTQSLMKAPESAEGFPLQATVRNEFGDLIETFNRMVASMQEQRSGLNDTLSMLDSMLANAPVGLAFFDQAGRFVRVNQVFAEMTRIPLSRHLGRTVRELLPEPASRELGDAVSQVFKGDVVRNLELSGAQETDGRSWNRLVIAYPVQPRPNQVRWVGVIMLDTSERKRSEETLRRTEKLAAAGRLAASIAHEINNPLEAITNLIFLLRNYCHLDEPAAGYLEMAEHEARRIAEITQQTLRFYRQSTLPTRADVAELVDSVLRLYQVKLRNLNIAVERDYDPETDLFCFAGEVRQVIANLVGNSIDAMAGGGRLILRARRSRSWKDPQLAGVRFTVADTGIGMDGEVRRHIFEPFFTTKDVIGTGLGLWVSHEIIRKHHGLVHVRSRPAAVGRPSGTVFEVFIPDDQERSASEPEVLELAKAG